MAVFTIAGLTLKEAMRRRTLLGAILIGVLILGLSLTLVPIRNHMEYMVSRSWRNAYWFALEYPRVRTHITTLCLAAIRILSSIFAILLAGGAISGEIERGLLAVILPKPLRRWEIFCGKWIGLNVILMGSVLVWTGLVWASLTLQTRADLHPILRAGLYLCLLPLVISTVTLTLSTITSRFLGTALALGLSAFSWFDGILNALGREYDVDVLHSVANFASMVVPQGCVAWWIHNVMEDITYPDPRVPQLGESPQFVKAWGQAHLHGFAYLDGVYFAAYVALVFLLGILLFQRRDV